MKHYKQLPYTFVYLIAFFLLADVRYLQSCFCLTRAYRSWSQGLNTTGTLVSICQNDKFEFSFLQNTYLGLSQAITSTIRCVAMYDLSVLGDPINHLHSTGGFWYIQRYWKIPTKRMVSGGKPMYLESAGLTMPHLSSSSSPTSLQLSSHCGV